RREDPEPLPRREEGRGRRCGAGRARRRGAPRRLEGAHPRAAEGMEGGRAEAVGRHDPGGNAAARSAPADGRRAPVVAMADPLEIDVFWSFRSPWSYLATPRLRAWQERYALTVRFRPVYPLAIRTPEFFDKLHPLWPSYFFRDLFRVAEMIGLPMARPQPDPV